MTDLTFWETLRKEALERDIRQCKTLAKSNNTQMVLDHPDWCRDAQQNNYVVMMKFIKDKHTKITETELIRRKKLGHRLSR